MVCGGQKVQLVSLLSILAKMSNFMDVVSGNKQPKAPVHKPWVEKWRPQKVEDVSHQAEVVQTLKTSIEQGSLPHLLFHGPPGTGKTTTILAVARALYGPTLYKDRILELNASDERGISVIRDKVKVFAAGAVGNQREAGYPCPKFKMIILDEADTMTADAQSALRRVIEAYSRVTRFCLICNYVTRVIEPLASRCAKFRFRPLPGESMRDRVTFIAEKESVNIQTPAIDTILKTSGGDMRKAVTFLQSAAQLSGGDEVTVETVIDVSGQVPDDVMANLWTAMEANKGLDPVVKAVQDIVAEGYPMQMLLQQLHDDIVVKKGVSDAVKGQLCEKLGHADLCLVDGAAEELQLLDVAAYITRRLQSNDAKVSETLAH
jgi:replication factor C subunit 2/4